MFSKFIRAVTCVQISFFLRLNNVLLYSHTTSRLSIHPLMDSRAVSAFLLLWIMLLWTSMCKYLLRLFNSFKYMPRSGIAGSHVGLFLMMRNLPAVFHGGCSTSHPTAVHRGCNFPTSWPALAPFCFVRGAILVSGCEVRCAVGFCVLISYPATPDELVSLL